MSRGIGLDFVDSCLVVISMRDYLWGLGFRLAES